MTSTERETFDALTAEHQLFAEWTSAEGYHRDDSGWEHQLFRFRFGIAGDTLGDTITYRQGTGHDEDPTASDLLAAIFMDAGTAAPYDEMPDDDAWLSWAEDLGYFGEGANVEKIKQARDGYKSCAAWYRLLKERLGEDALSALIDAAQQL
jgi:hypothetical protein